MRQLWTEAKAGALEGAVGPAPLLAASAESSVTSFLDSECEPVSLRVCQGLGHLRQIVAACRAAGNTSGAPASARAARVVSSPGHIESVVHSAVQSVADGSPGPGLPWYLDAALPASTLALFGLYTTVDGRLAVLADVDPAILCAPITLAAWAGSVSDQDWRGACAGRAAAMAVHEMVHVDGGNSVRGSTPPPAVCEWAAAGPGLAAAQSVCVGGVTLLSETGLPCQPSLSVAITCAMGVRRAFNVRADTLYLLDLSLERLSREMAEDLGRAYGISTLPAGPLCGLRHVPSESHTFMGPNVYTTPAGSFTWVHQDGVGTVDSGHQSLGGVNEVIMFQRLTDASKQMVLNTLANTAGGYSPRTAVHDDGAKPAWPTRAALGELEASGIHASHFVLWPGDFVHINKGRLHAFRKLHGSHPAALAFGLRPIDIQWRSMGQGGDVVAGSSQVHDGLAASTGQPPLGAAVSSVCSVHACHGAGMIGCIPVWEQEVPVAEDGRIERAHALGLWRAFLGKYCGDGGVAPKAVVAGGLSMSFIPTVVLASVVRDIRRWRLDVARTSCAPYIDMCTSVAWDWFFEGGSAQGMLQEMSCAIDAEVGNALFSAKNIGSVGLVIAGGVSHALALAHRDVRGAVAAAAVRVRTSATGGGRVRAVHNRAAVGPSGTPLVSTIGEHVRAHVADTTRIAAGVVSAAIAMGGDGGRQLLWGSRATVVHIPLRCLHSNASDDVGHHLVPVAWPRRGEVVAGPLGSEGMEWESWAAGSLLVASQHHAHATQSSRTALQSTLDSIARDTRHTARRKVAARPGRDASASATVAAGGAGSGVAAGDVLLASKKELKASLAALGRGQPSSGIGGADVPKLQPWSSFHVPPSAPAPSHRQGTRGKKRPRTSIIPGEVDAAAAKLSDAEELARNAVLVSPVSAAELGVSHSIDVWWDSLSARLARGVHGICASLLPKVVGGQVGRVVCGLPVLPVTTRACGVLQPHLDIKRVDLEERRLRTEGALLTTLGVKEDLQTVLFLEPEAAAASGSCHHLNGLRMSVRGAGRMVPSRGEAARRLPEVASDVLVDTEDGVDGGDMDPDGVEGYFCVQCHIQLVGEYVACVGCDVLLRTDTRLCLSCARASRLLVDETSRGGEREQACMTGDTCHVLPSWARRRGTPACSAGMLSRVGAIPCRMCGADVKDGCVCHCIYVRRWRWWGPREDALRQLRLTALAAEQPCPPVPGVKYRCTSVESSSLLHPTSLWAKRLLSGVLWVGDRGSADIAQSVGGAGAGVCSCEDGLLTDASSLGEALWASTVMTLWNLSLKDCASIPTSPPPLPACAMQPPGVTAIPAGDPSQVDRQKWGQVWRSWAGIERSSWWHLSGAQRTLSQFRMNSLADLAATGKAGGAVAARHTGASGGWHVAIAHGILCAVTATAQAPGGSTSSHDDLDVSLCYGAGIGAIDEQDGWGSIALHS